MDKTQSNYLKAYGLVYWVLEQNLETYWLLNYRGGSFTFEYTDASKLECIKRGISYKNGINYCFSQKTDQTQGQNIRRK